MIPRIASFNYLVAARLHNPTLSLWLSVDPLADKYPGVSPYVYCANNPVRLVDKDGREIGYVDEASQKKINALTNKNSADYSRAFTRQYRRLERSKQVYNFYEATDNEITTSIQGKVTKNDNGSIDIYHSSVPSARTSSEGGFSRKYATLFEETYHAADYDRGRLDLDNPTCMDEARAWKFAAKAPGTNSYASYYPKRVATFATTVRELSRKALADFFYKGGDTFVSYDDDGIATIHPVLTGPKNSGIYSHLPLK